MFTDVLIPYYCHRGAGVSAAEQSWVTGRVHVRGGVGLGGVYYPMLDRAELCWCMCSVQVVNSV